MDMERAGLIEINYSSFSFLTCINYAEWNGFIYIQRSHTLRVLTGINQRSSLFKWSQKKNGSTFKSECIRNRILMMIYMFWLRYTFDAAFIFKWMLMNAWVHRFMYDDLLKWMNWNEIWIYWKNLFRLH